MTICLFFCIQSPRQHESHTQDDAEMDLLAAAPAVVEDQLFHIDDQLITIDENLEEITDEFLHLDEQGGAPRS